MGIMPVRISRETWFSLSTSFCMMRNLGMTRLNISSITPISAATASTIIQLRLLLVWATRQMPPMPRMGA